MERQFSLSEKTILVTGASSGIGRGIAIACSKMGASVIITGRNMQKLQETLSAMSGENRCVSADISQMLGIQDLVNSLPPLDGVVHCAGVGQRKMCKFLEEIDVDYVMNINFKAPALLQAELLKQKKIKKGASIVFITSMAVESPSIGNAVYSASKGALLSYSLCLKEELASKLIRVNCISPAMVWTDLILSDGISREQILEDEKRYPLKRYGQPEDIANLAVYLLSDASSWMTGSNIKITGGS